MGSLSDTLFPHSQSLFFGLGFDLNATSETWTRCSNVSLAWVTGNAGDTAVQLYYRHPSNELELVMELGSSSSTSLQWSVPEQAILGDGYFYRVRSAVNPELYTDSVTHSLADADCRNKSCSDVVPAAYNLAVGECECPADRMGNDCELAADPLLAGYTIIKRTVPNAGNYTVTDSSTLAMCGAACGQDATCTTFAMARSWTANAEQCRLYANTSAGSQGIAERSCFGIQCVLTCCCRLDRLGSLLEAQLYRSKLPALSGR